MVTTLGGLGKPWGTEEHQVSESVQKCMDQFRFLWRKINLAKGSHETYLWDWGDPTKRTYGNLWESFSYFMGARVSHAPSLFQYRESSRAHNSEEQKNVRTKLQVTSYKLQVRCICEYRPTLGHFNTIDQLTVARTKKKHYPKFSNQATVYYKSGDKRDSTRVNHNGECRNIRNWQGPLHKVRWQKHELQSMVRQEPSHDGQSNGWLLGSN